MPSPTEISVAQLSRIIGLPGAPMFVDVRPCADGSSGRHVLPAAQQMESQSVSLWADKFSGQRVVVFCRDGGDPRQGTPGWLRPPGLYAQTLQGGFETWRAAFHAAIHPD